VHGSTVRGEFRCMMVGSRRAGALLDCWPTRCGPLVFRCAQLQWFPRRLPCRSSDLRVCAARQGRLDPIHVGQ
jgi:hypothetical protein